MNIRRLATHLVKLLLTAIILYFLARQVFSHWDSIREYDWEVHPGWLIISLALGALAFFVQAASWRMIIRSFGHSVRLMMSYKIIYLSNLGRYVPGKVWQLFGMLYLTKKKGISPEEATASFVLVQVFGVPASLLAFALANQMRSVVLVEQVGLFGPGTTWLITIGMLAFCAVAVFATGRLQGVGNWLLKLINRPPVKFAMDKTVALKIFSGYFAAWIVYGTAFWCFLKAVSPERSPDVIVAIGIFNLAYQIGYLALFAPGGFGPRELVLGSLLAPFFGPIAAAVAVLARLWAIAIEAIAAVMALMVKTDTESRAETSPAGE